MTGRDRTGRKGVGVYLKLLNYIYSEKNILQKTPAVMKQSEGSWSPRLRTMKVECRTALKHTVGEVINSPKTEQSSCPVALL